MKLFIGIFTLLTISIALILTNRDLGMWVMNNSMKLASSQEIVEHVQFAELERHRLDIYPQEQIAPVVVFIHGGSWRHGRKDQYYFAAESFARLGYTVVVPDYIKHPAARFPVFIEDGAKAVAWTKANISKYNGDPDNIFVAGHSAGAHTVGLLATDEKYLAAQGLSKNDIRGVAGIAGPYAFVPDWSVTIETFGPPSNYPIMNALNHVDGTEPPLLLLHSSADTQVGLQNQTGFADKLKGAGSQVKTILYGELSHIDIVLYLHPWFGGDNSVANDIDSFFRTLLKN